MASKVLVHIAFGAPSARLEPIFITKSASSTFSGLIRDPRSLCNTGDITGLIEFSVIAALSKVKGTEKMQNSKIEKLKA